MFGPRMRSGCFKSVLLLEEGFGDGKLLLSAELQQQAPVVVAVTNAVCAKYSFPGICLLAHPIIEINKDYHLVVSMGALETSVVLRVQFVFSSKFSRKSWILHTEKRGIPLFSEEGAWTSFARDDQLPDFLAWRRRRFSPWNRCMKGALLL